MVRYFSAPRLPTGLSREAADICGTFARGIDAMLPDCAEKTAGLRKLLEAMDCFIRAAMDSESEASQERGRQGGEDPATEAPSSTGPQWTRGQTRPFAELEGSFRARTIEDLKRQVVLDGGRLVCCTTDPQETPPGTLH